MRVRAEVLLIWMYGMVVLVVVVVVVVVFVLGEAV